MAFGGGLGAFLGGIMSAGLLASVYVYATYTMKTNLGSASADVNETFDNTISAGKEGTGWFTLLILGGMAGIVLGFFGGRALMNR